MEPPDKPALVSASTLLNHNRAENTGQLSPWTSSQSRETQSTPESIENPNSQHQQQGQTATAKVAIPRHRGGVAPRFSRRVAKACESCRQRKTKCSGDTPVCRQCRELKVKCQYPDGLREKTKRHLEQLSSKSDDYESLLKDLRSSVDDGLAKRITTTLSKYAPDDEHNRTEPLSSSSRTPLDDVELEPSSPSSIGSLEAIDRVEEDLNRGENVRATGYIGKNSEISWMQRVQREAEQRSRKQPGMVEGGPQDFSINAVSYHLDDLDISVPDPVDMYAIPSREQAERFFDDYLTTVHPFFPIINRPLFRSQFKFFFENPCQPGDKWRAILNMIFAIAAKHSHLAQAPWRADDHQDHLLYFTRARYLSMTGDVLFSHPDLQQIQVEGLIAFYLLSTDQINRAWRISSVAVRSAITLGINMKSSSETTTNISKESRYRVWWALYSFEHLLGVMTGRATCILDGICTTPMPIPFEEERFSDPDVNEILSDPSLREKNVQEAVASHLIRLTPVHPVGRNSEKSSRSNWLQKIPFNTGLSFLLFIDISVITQEIINKVYTADAVKLPWSTIENRIGELKSRIDLWFKQLPDAFNFVQKESNSAEQVRSKLGLAFQYYSARITLGRPCLCRRDSQSNESTSFSHKMALVSLDAAARMLDLIPETPDPLQLYQLAPWWCILHYLMQAATVLLLELSFGCVHVPEDESRIFEAAKKAIRWLYAMSEYSTASRRAWRLCDDCMRRIAVGMDFDVSDLPPLPNDSIPQERYQVPHSQQVATTASSAAPVTSVGSGPAGGETFDWSTGMEPVGSFSAETQPQEIQGLSEYDSSINNPELVSYPMSFPPSMVFTSSNELHFPYDPLTGEFMGSFFPHPGDDHVWEN
ncbi:putative C6 transcription factor [Talaromyces proteolyticus]|uniref:C6 transcription factor n=1 Tax=Talaromyces proteolyticus TaxID=1131652 RepID=A0AAD4KPJ2_9EURO|nr:putative C6 transcription factor [Talaromyces proteolyticus]KAH8695363.1 putative C6 transcription factor [Talaromyces proteolyticus]